MHLLILTGASGSGKTTIVEAISRRFPAVTCFVFDSIGIPSPEEMIRLHGSGEEWQRATTIAWIKRLHDGSAANANVIFEGQTRIEFLREGLALWPIAGAKILLVECSDEVRHARLRGGRGQPELANDQMLSWATFLRTEAQRFGVEILDTTALTLDESVDRVVKIIAPDRR